MTQSRSLGATSSALVLLLLLGTGMAQTCTLTLGQLASGAAQCIGGIYAGVANDGNVQALTAAAVAEMGLPSQVSGPMTYVTAAALLQPRIAEVIGFVRGGLGCMFTNASVDQTASAIWAGVKMIFQAHCSYVAPVISSCMRNVSQPATCGNRTSYVTNATNSLLGMYCNTTTWQFNEQLSAGLAYEIQQVIGGMCSGSKVPAAVSDPIFADLANAGNLLVGIVSGGAFSANDVVGLLLSSATNGSLSWLDLRSLPQLASNVALVCKSQLPAVASLTLGLPSNSPLLDAVGSLCDGLTASLKNVSTPAQLVLAVAKLVGDATTAVGNVASAAQFAEALAKVALGPAPAGNLTAVANMSYQAAAAVAAALANVTGSMQQPLNGSSSVQFDPIQAVVYAVVGAALDPNGYTCGLATRLGQLASGSLAALAPLSKSGNLVAAELLRMASNNTVAKALIDASARPGGCTPAVAAGLLRQLSGSALVPANCTITGYDSIVACLTADDAAASSADGAAAVALDRLRDALTYALLTGLQNATRAPADLARLTGVSGLLNNTLPHLSNLTAVLAQVDQVAMAVAGQFANAFAAPIAGFASASLSSPWQYVDAALTPVCNVTRQAAAAVDVALAQQTATGNYVARDLLALARSPMAQTLGATVQNVTQQVCDCSQTALAVHRAVMAYIAQQRLPANDSTKIIQFACNSKTPVALFAAIRGALVTLSSARNPCAASALAQLGSAYFNVALGYVLNATRMGCDEYTLGQALYAVFDKSAKPFNVYTDPYGFLNFFLNQAAWDGFEAASQKTFSTLARAGNVAAIQALQLLGSAEFREAYGYFDNVTTTIRSFVSLFTKTCLRSDMQSSLVGSMLYGYYGLTQEALDTLRCGSVEIGRCALRAMNKASGGAVDSMRGEIASGSAVAAYVTGLPFLNMGDMLAYNEPTNDYSPKAKTAVVAFFGGGWMLSAAASAPKKCSEILSETILITNRNYTLTRSYDWFSGVESVDLTFYAIDKSGAQSSVARYSVKSDLNSGPLKTAPVTLTNSAGKAAKTSQGFGFNVALTVNATSKLVKIVDSVSKAGFAFYVNPKTRNVAAVVRGTKAAIQTSFGSFVCGCMNSDPTAKMIGTPRPICFVKCSAPKQTVCKPAECAAVKQYQYAGLDVVDYMEKTT